MVYVLSKNGQPIMPTKNHAKVRLLLKSGKAKVVNRCPFTIQLTGVCKTFTQEVSLGVDAGSRHIGLSATTKKVCFLKLMLRLEMILLTCFLVGESQDALVDTEKHGTEKQDS